MHLATKSLLFALDAVCVLAQQDPAQSSLVEHHFRCYCCGRFDPVTINGRALVGECHGGAPVGTWVARAENGVVIARRRFVNGRQEGPDTVWHDNGQTARVGNYQAGERTGDWQTWHQNGRLASSGSFVNGRREGTWVELDWRGDTTSVCPYQAGKRHGKSFVQKRRGYPTEAEYRNDTLVWQVTHNVDGTRTKTEFDRPANRKTITVYRDSTQLSSATKFIAGLKADRRGMHTVEDPADTSQAGALVSEVCRLYGKARGDVFVKHCYSTPAALVSVSTARDDTPSVYAIVRERQRERAVLVPLQSMQLCARARLVGDQSYLLMRLCRARDTVRDSELYRKFWESSEARDRPNRWPAPRHTTVLPADSVAVYEIRFVDHCHYAQGYTKFPFLVLLATGSGRLVIPQWRTVGIEEMRHGLAAIRDGVKKETYVPRVWFLKHHRLTPRICSGTMVTEDALEELRAGLVWEDGSEWWFRLSCGDASENLPRAPTLTVSKATRQVLFYGWRSCEHLAVGSVTFISRVRLCDCHTHPGREMHRRNAKGMMCSVELVEEIHGTHWLESGDVTRPWDRCWPNSEDDTWLLIATGRWPSSAKLLKEVPDTGTGPLRYVDLSGGVRDTLTLKDVLRTYGIARDSER